MHCKPRLCPGRVQVAASLTAEDTSATLRYWPAHQAALLIIPTIPAGILMRYQLLGNTGLFVSELCLGTMNFGGAGEMWSKIG